MNEATTLQTGSHTLRRPVPVWSRRTHHPKKRTTVRLRGNDEGLPPESKQYWHQGVTLLSSFALVYVVGDTLVVLPPIGGRGAIELPDEGNDVWSNPAQSLQHGGNEVECPNSVDGHHPLMMGQIHTALGRRGLRTRCQLWWTKRIETERCWLQPLC